MSVSRGRGLLAALFLPLLVAAAVPARAASEDVVLGWNAYGSTDDYVAQAARAPGLNTVSPAWWLLRRDGSIRDAGDRRYSSWAHVHGMRVWPLFGNGTDQKTSHRVLTDRVLRATVIGRITALAAGEDADGVNLDWENVATADRDAFSAFVREAAAAWRAAGLVVSVDVTARTDTWQLGDWTESLDRRALASAADFLVLMAYDQHNRLRPVGPTAALPWVRDSIEYLLRDAPASKVILGVPFYTQDWSADPHRRMETVTFARIAGRLRAYRATVRWDSAAGQSIATYTRAGFGHRVWIEDARSLAPKAALVRDYGLAGIAAWRIGFETPTAWRALALPVVRAPKPAPVRSAPVATPRAEPVASPAPATTTSPATRASSRAPLATGGVVMALVVAGLAAARLRRAQRTSSAASRGPSRVPNSVSVNANTSTAVGASDPPGSSRDASGS